MALLTETMATRGIKSANGSDIFTREYLSGVGGFLRESFAPVDPHASFDAIRASIVADPTVRSYFEPLPNYPVPSFVQKVRDIKRHIDTSSDLTLGSWMMNNAGGAQIPGPPFAELDGAHVIIADDVARYMALLPAPIRLSEHAVTVAPPLEQFFVEYAWVPPAANRQRVAVLFTSSEVTEDSPEYRILGERPRWMMNLDVYIQNDDRSVVGPVASVGLPLDHDGQLYMTGSANDRTVVYALSSRFPGFNNSEYAAPGTFAFELDQQVRSMLAPALATVSFMHCKNVELVERPANSQRHGRKKGPVKPSLRFHTLKIDALTKLLDAAGQAREKGYGHALSICAGHFKTYGEEAKLFGKHTGRYFWHPQVRGNLRAGIVTKNYEIATGALPSTPALGSTLDAAGPTNLA